MRSVWLDQISVAKELARIAHDGQVRKDGSAYLGHIERVAGQFPAGSLESVVAWLHDIVEDTPVTVDSLYTFGFSGTVVLAVDAITRRDGERYSEYIERCKENDVARRVKLADLKDNNVPSELEVLGLPGLGRRYSRAIEALS